MLKLVFISLVLTAVSCRPKETTHDILSRLGFDPIQKPGVNYHKKRVVDESDKARFSPTAYNSDTDSHMFVVRLPPHHSYYSKVRPEKIENEVVAKRPMVFPSNGKPAQVYHWNIPLIKKLAKQKKTHHHDSKIVHLKILPNEIDEYNKYYHKMRKEGKPSVYKLKGKEHVRPMSISELAEHQNDRPIPVHTGKSKKVDKDSKFTHVVPLTKVMSRKKSEKDTSTKLSFVKASHNEINKYENEEKSGKAPIVYSPALPKHNSFLKYFPNNGKPKSFYVIEKGENQGRLHRLL